MGRLATQSKKSVNFKIDMKEARSLYFDGLIKAQECDYLSYRDFGLICPECATPVFLASGGIIEPHFHHFRAKEGQPNCSLRYRSSSKVRQLHHSKIGSQREIIFREHFWDIFDTVSVCDFKRMKYKLFTSEIEWSVHRDWIKGWQTAFQTNRLKPLVDSCVEVMFDSLSKIDISQDLISCYSASGYCNAFNQEVHRKTLYSITEFLARDKSEEFLMVLFYCGLGVYINKFGESSLDQTSDAYPWISIAVLQLISIVPWAEAAHAMHMGSSFTPRQQIFTLPKLSVPQTLECYRFWHSSNTSAKSKFNWLTIWKN